MQQPSEFTRDLASVLNRHCKDNFTNTPDFILAEMIETFIGVVRIMHKDRDEWHGFKPMSPWGDGTNSEPTVTEL